MITQHFDHLKPGNHLKLYLITGEIFIVVFLCCTKSNLRFTNVNRKGLHSIKLKIIKSYENLGVIEILN